jgi:RNA polymerase sigma factor (sigma-70 family)
MKMNLPALHAKHAILISAWQKDKNQHAIAEILSDYEPLINKAVRLAMRGQMFSVNHIDDMKQECSVALVKAIDGYDSEKGAYLTSYLNTYIKCALLRYKLDFQAPCRLGSSSEDRKAYYAAQRLRAQKNDGHNRLTYKDIELVARDSATSIKIAKRAVQAIDATPTSLDDVVDLVSDASTAQISIDRWSTQEAMSTFDRLQHELDDRTRDIICTTFLSHHIEGAVTRMADKYDLTPRRIRQIQTEGLKKIKILMEQNGIDAECIF